MEIKKEYEVLDKGFVRLIDIMGNDLTPVERQRVSYGNGLTTPERDYKLLNFLMKEGHHTPFEHVVLTFHVRTPIFIQRQWFRHRISTFNEISRRYTTKYSEDFYVPDHIRTQDTKNKQGSVRSNNEELTKEDLKLIQYQYDYTYKIYKELLSHGVQREMQRMVLPVGQYTEFHWTVNFRSLMNFLNLRQDSHAQWEIQQYQIQIQKIVKELLPKSYEQFIEHYYKGDILNNVGI